MPYHKRNQFFNSSKTANKKRRCRVESDTFSALLPMISYDTSLILVDLDNTVFWPGQYLGSDQWFLQIGAYLREHINNPDKLLPLWIGIYNEVTQQSQAQLCEEKTRLLLKALQHIGFEVVGITARGQTLHDTTWRQLKNLDVELDDIIFCSGQNKGEKLLSWYYQTSKQPIGSKPYWQQVVMIDDKEKHLNHVNEVLRTFKIKCKQVRYGKMDCQFVDIDSPQNAMSAIEAVNFSSELSSMMANIGCIARQNLSLTS